MVWECGRFLQGISGSLMFTTQPAATGAAQYASQQFIFVDVRLLEWLGKSPK